MGFKNIVQILDDGLRALHRELRVSSTPVVQPEKWAFVVGCYNSGTELLATLLGTHPAITALPTEGQFLTDQFKRDYELGLPRMWVQREDLFRLTEANVGPDAKRLKREWIMRLDRSKPIFLEKSPPNAARTRWLQAHFERSHFIAIVRNGYAVAEGIRRKAEPHHLPGPWPIKACAHQWARSNEVLLEDADHLENVLWVRYEDLAEHTTEELARIVEFLGLAKDEGEIDIEGPWAIHEREEPIRNMNQASIERLDAQDRRIITTEAGAMLDRLGYEKLA